MDKICKITNNQKIWTLEVDGKVINFQGEDNVDYFVQHYVNLGYVVNVDRKEILLKVGKK